MEKPIVNNQFRRLGNSGLRLYPVGLGAMPMSISGRPPEEVSLRVIWAALDAGINLIDTADCYCIDDKDIGHNERLVAKALREWRGGHDVLVATKGGVRRPNGAWVHDGRPEHLKQACEASMRALGIDRISLYQLHALDERVPLEDSVGALVRLQQEGKIQHIGLSNVDVEQIRRASKIATIVSVQNKTSPYFLSGLTDGVLRLCEAEGIAFIAYSPLGGPRASRIAHEPILRKLAQQYQMTPYQVVLCWLLQKSKAIIPIPGASKVQSAEDSARAANLHLEKKDLEELEKEFEVTPMRG